MKQSQSQSHGGYDNGINMSDTNTNNNGNSNNNTNSNSDSNNIHVELQQCWEMRIVPCSHLRVLAPISKHPQYSQSHNTHQIHNKHDKHDKHPSSSDIIDDLVEMMLKGDMTDRPHIREIHTLVTKRLQWLQDKGNIIYYSNSHSYAEV